MAGESQFNIPNGLSLFSGFLLSASLAMGGLGMVSQVALAAEGETFSLAIEWSVADNASQAAEILAASEDGQTLVYTDSPGEQLGFVGISDPAAPKGEGVLALPDEPTSLDGCGC